MKTLATLLASLLLAACAARTPAPVDERMPMYPAPPPVAATPAPQTAPAPPPKPVPTHTVKRGETLVSIALQYGLDYRDLAAWNNISNPAHIAVGQVLILAPPGSLAAAPPGAPALGAVPYNAAPAGAAPGIPPARGATAGAPGLRGPGDIVTQPLLGAGPPIEARPGANTPTLKVEPRGEKLPYSDKVLAQLSAEAGATAPVEGVAAPPSSATPPKAPGTDQEDIDWMWPVKGTVIAPFSETSKGMDIAGRKGEPVRAAASGRVIYADAGLRGYGKLVIIRHNNKWLSAYAHNDKILVKEQQEVKKGQEIAEMGATDADRVKLHFEIRRQGKPVDPEKILPAMPAR